MTWFRVGGAGIPATLKNAMNAVFNKKFGTTGQNYPPNGWPADVNLLGPLPEKTVAGAIAHTDDAADTVPVKSLICSIVPKQAGSGTPSPTNVRAITGYSGMTISRLGKNLFNVSNYSEIYTERDGVDSYNYRYKIIQLKPNTTYTVSQNSGSYSGTPIILINNTLPVGGVDYFDLRKASDTKTYTTDETGCLYIGSVNSYDDVAYARLQVCNVQIEVGSIATTFTPFVTPETISDGWSSIGTIYGGERDLTEGTLSEKWALLSLAVADMNNTNENYPGWKGCGIKALVGPDKGYISVGDFLVNVGTWLGVNTNGTNDICFLPYSSYGLTQTEWKTNYPDLVVQIAVKLATPVEYTNLQTYDFETLYAVNNFYSDIEGGQTQVTYRQDIALALAALQGSRSLSASLMRSAGPDLEERSDDPEEVSELEENIQNTEEQEGDNDAR